MEQVTIVHYQEEKGPATNVGFMSRPLLKGNETAAGSPCNVRTISTDSHTTLLDSNRVQLKQRDLMGEVSVAFQSKGDSSSGKASFVALHKLFTSAIG